MKKLTTFVLVLALSAALLIGCTAPQQTAAVAEAHNAQVEIQPELQPEKLAGGVLRLKINPEIALHYDASGKVTKLEGKNADGVQLLQNVTDCVGKDTSQVLEELVQVIGKAGYFVEEAEGKARKIVLELDPGSEVPHEKFLEDMAAHVKACVESKSWNGEREFDYREPAAPATQPAETTATPKATETTPAPKAAETTAAKKETASEIPAGLCPVCADDDCNDGIYCDDGHEKAENLKEYERLMRGDVCPTCADPDCDDGKYCDDADEKKENQRENAAKKAASTKSASSNTKKTTTSTKKTTTSAKKTSTRCAVCGDNDCDDGKYCDDWDDRYDDHHDDHHGDRDWDDD